jgi:hypothetical protein
VANPPLPASPPEGSAPPSLALTGRGHGTDRAILPHQLQFGLVRLLFFVKFDKIRSFLVFWGHWKRVRLL